MTRYHLFPMLIPKGEIFELKIGIDSGNLYSVTETVWHNTLLYLQKEWYKRWWYQPWLCWEIHGQPHLTQYFFWASDSITSEEFLNRWIAHNFHEIVHGMPPEPDFSRPHAGIKLLLERDFSVPLEVVKEKDSHELLLGTLANLAQGQHAIVQILIRPAYEKVVSKYFNRALKYLEKDKKAPAGENQLLLDAIKRKKEKAKAEVAIRLLAFANTQEEAERVVEHLARSFSVLESVELNRFVRRKWWQLIRPLFRYEFKHRIFPIRAFPNAVVLGTDELANLARMPEGAGSTRLLKLKFRKVLMPIDLRSQSFADVPKILLGRNKVHFFNFEINLPLEFVPRHLAVFGGPQQGKTTFLLNYLLQFLRYRTEENKYGFTVIDSKGELADELLARIPKEYRHLIEVIRFREKKVPFNVFNHDLPINLTNKARMVAGLFKSLVKDGWDANTEEFVFNGGVALLKLNMANLQHLIQLVEDDQFLQQVIAELPDDDPQVVSAKRFLEKYSKIKDQMGKVFISFSTLSKLRVLDQGSIGPILNAYSNGVNIWEALNEGKLLILDLSGLGSTDKLFAGIALLQHFSVAWRCRQSLLDQGKSLPLHLLAVDEASQFMENGISNMEFFADEARKYQVALAFAIQGIQNHIPSKHADAMFRNFGTVVTFQLGNPKDAEFAFERLNAFGLNKESFQYLEPNWAFIQFPYGRDKSKCVTLFLEQPEPAQFIDDLPDLLQKTIEKALRKEEEAKKKVKKLSIHSKAEQSDQKNEQIEVASFEMKKSFDDEDYLDYFL